MTNAIEPDHREKLAKALYDADYHPAMADDREWSDLSEMDPLRQRYLGRAQGAAEVHGLRFRVGVACDGYSALTPDDVPLTVWDEDDYIRGARDAAEAIRAALTGEARDE